MSELLLVCVQWVLFVVMVCGAIAIYPYGQNMTVWWCVFVQSTSSQFILCAYNFLTAHITGTLSAKFSHFWFKHHWSLLFDTFICDLDTGWQSIRCTNAQTVQDNFLQTPDLNSDCVRCLDNLIWRFYSVYHFNVKKQVELKQFGNTLNLQ